MKFFTTDRAEFRISRRLQAIDKINRKDVYENVDREKKMFDRSLRLESAVLIERNHQRFERSNANRSRKHTEKESSRMFSWSQPVLSGERLHQNTHGKTSNSRLKKPKIKDASNINTDISSFFPPVKIPTMIREETDEEILQNSNTSEITTKVNIKEAVEQQHSQKKKNEENQKLENALLSRSEEKILPFLEDKNNTSDKSLEGFNANYKIYSTPLQHATKLKTFSRLYKLPPIKEKI